VATLPCVVLKQHAATVSPCASAGGGTGVGSAPAYAVC
jgi:hypothetical protein